LSSESKVADKFCFTLIYPSDQDFERMRKKIMDEDTIKCPKCGQINPNTNTCLSCGIIFAKYRESQSEPTSVATNEKTPKVKKVKKVYILLPLLIFSSGLIYWWFFTPDVKVYVEVVYTPTEVQAYIFADVYPEFCTQISAMNTLQ